MKYSIELAKAHQFIANAEHTLAVVIDNLLSYYDPNYKTVGGESQVDVRNRVYGGLLDILSKHKDKRVAIFSHGYAITFLLLKWCKLINIDCNHKFTISYNDKIIYDKKINAPEVFKLTFDGTNLKNLECIEFEDLEFMDKI